jgi:hypothetical protein
MGFECKSKSTLLAGCHRFPSWGFQMLLFEKRKTGWWLPFEIPGLNFQQGA